MKNFFKSIEEWMQSNPAEETKEQVMKLINRHTIRELRQEIRTKEQSLRKAEKILKSTKDLGLDTSATEGFIENLNKEITEMKKDLPKETPKKEENNTDKK